MKLIISFIIAFVFSFITVNAQNQFDDNGLRTGFWTGYYPDSTLKYEVNFIRGKPSGLMKRYDNKGILSMTLSYTYSNPERCFAHMYSSNGSVRAKGVYENREKDSVWVYLGSNAEIRMSETYNKGALNGVTRYFYHTGKESQKINYVNGLKEGEWYKYFENGDTMMTAEYLNDELTGPYRTYYQNGNIQISGQYKKDLKDGTWNYFDENGDTLLVLKYISGEIQNPELLKKTYEQFIEKLEKNAGNLPDPDRGDF